MALLTEADFRDPVPNEVCQGLQLEDAEAPASLLTAAIARLTAKLNIYTDDFFEPRSLTIDLDGGDRARLILPYRCTSLTSVSLRDQNDVLTVQAAAVYRFTSSLNAAGAEAVGDFDYIDVVPQGDGLTGGPTGSGATRWPAGPKTVRVIGSFGWTTVPVDVKRALALMVFHHFKPIRGDLRLATRVTTADQVTDFAATDPTGIPEADEIISAYRRDILVGVG